MDQSEILSERTFFRVGEGSPKIIKRRTGISILVAFSSGHFRSSEGVEGVKMSKIEIFDGH